MPRLILSSSTTRLLTDGALFLYAGYLASVPWQVKVKGKVLPYSLPSVEPRADPGVQAVSPQVT